MFGRFQLTRAAGFRRDLFRQPQAGSLSKAKAVVLCANGSESPRLLLLSTSNLFPDGLANSSGLVGKYLMLGELRALPAFSMSR